MARSPLKATRKKKSRRLRVISFAQFSGFTRGQIEVRLMEAERTIQMLQARIQGMQHAMAATDAEKKLADGRLTEAGKPA